MAFPTISHYPRVTVILREVPTAVIHEIVNVIAERQLDLAIEVTRNSTNFTQVRSLIASYPDVLLGAGTILTLDDARLAADMGCRFILSPVVLPAEVVDLAHGAGMLAIPGAYTPTEVHAAAANGADIVKLFPVRDLPPSYVRDIRAPLGPIPLMGVGGISTSNITTMFERGLEHVGIGSSLFGKELADVDHGTIAHKLVELAGLGQTVI